MLSFKPIQIEDRETINAFTIPSDFINCDYAFANMYSWRFLYDSEFAVQDGFLFIRFFVTIKKKKQLAYMFPVGNGDLQQAIDYIEKDAQNSGHSLLILGVTPESRKKLELLFPSKFSFSPERDYYDYIYLREDLATFKGKKYQPKRNHINHFKKLYDYEYVPVTNEIMDECKKLEELWYEANTIAENNVSLFNERRSMCSAMNHFDELGLLGGAILVDNKIVAFTYGSPINYWTFGIHIEKADIHYEGIFSVISQEFVKHIPSQYIYVNREEDLGLPGLRKSKLSYHPHLLLEKNMANVKLKIKS